MDAYAPGDKELMKRWRVSCAMTTLSTVVYDQAIQHNRLDVQERALTVTVTPRFADKVQETIHAFDVSSRIYDERMEGVRDFLYSGDRRV